MALHQLRKEVLSACDLLQSLLALSFKLGPTRSEELDTIREQVTSANARTLRELRDRLAHNIKQLSVELGCRRAPRRLLPFIRREIAGSWAFGYMQKYVLEEIFSNYAQLVPDWRLFPAHTLIGLDFSGDRVPAGTLQWFLPEASLYEDMCIAYNQAVMSHYSPTKGVVEKIRFKTHGFYLRSAVSYAFYFVEAYLNGIAFDFCFRCEKGEIKREISEENYDVLMEWDSKRNRERWVAFREKILQYPKIVLDLDYPPLTESNCEEIKILLSEAKNLRDSLVHNSPRINLETILQTGHTIPPKVRAIVGLNLQDVTRIADCAVGFVLRVSELVTEPKQKLDWLCQRDSSGLFPDKVFE